MNDRKGTPEGVGSLFRRQHRNHDANACRGEKDSRPRSRRIRQAACVLTLVAFLGCGAGDQPKTDDGHQPPVELSAPISAKMIAEHNRAVGLMDQFKYDQAVAAFNKLLEEHPNWPDARVNLAIATANAQEGGSAAIPILQQVLEADPNHVRANFCSGALYVQIGELDPAIPYLKKTIELDPHDAYAMYLMGSCREAESGEEALQWYEKSIKADPYFYNPYYRCAQLYARMGMSEQAVQFSKDAQRLRTHPLRHELTFKYTQMGPKATCKLIDLPNAVPQPAPQGPLFQKAVPLIDADEQPPWRNRKLDDSDRRPSITACDINGDGKTDLFLSRTLEGANLHNAVVLQRDDGRFEVVMDHPLARVSGVNAALWGDLDNDGLTDVYLCRDGANQLWHQTERNRWLDVTEATQTSGGDFDTVDGAMFDADHDADLDLFLVNADGSNELLNNNLDGTFQPIAEQAGIAGDGRASRSVLVADLDGDRDQDIVVFNNLSPHEVYLNDRAWRYHQADGVDELTSTEISAAVCGDVVIDGQVELYTLSDRHVFRWVPDEQGVWTKKDLKTMSWPGSDEGRLALADITGDGALELIAGPHPWWTMYSVATGKARRLPSVSEDEQPEDLAITEWGLVNLDDSSGPSVIDMRSGYPPLISRPGTGRHKFLTLVCKGEQAPGSKREKSNSSGIGAQVEVRADSRLTVADYVRWQSGPGQSLQPLAIGLGGSATADFIRVTWTDGISQSELGLAPDQLHVIEELDRLPSSCPLLFVWNGQQFQFVSDVLAVGGLGYLVAPGEYAPPDPTEDFLLPADCLAARGDRFELKLTEPMQELTYLDSAQLVAYDLPPGWQMTLDERLATGSPQPTGKPQFFREIVIPSVVVDQRGEDVSALVRNVDNQAAPPGPLDRRFHGRLTDEHVLDFQFDEPIDDGRPILIADGWVEFPYSQTMFAAWQAGVTFDPPKLEARGADGNWHVVLDRFGYPGGMPRQISVPLDGLPKETTELRLRTNLEIYWDRLAIAYAQPCPDVRVLRLPLQTALLRESGFTPRIVLDQNRPHFEYDQRIPLADTLDPAGNYTRFGPVDELVNQTDNALAIFGPGEELHFEFAIPASESPVGWQRRFVLQLAGWCKDMDLYTGDGETVGPLPSQGIGGPQRDQLHQRYNTRMQQGR